MSHNIRIGTSGWNYNHWKEHFYPDELPQNGWFAHYCGVFDTVEINNTFYQQPENKTFDAWREQVPSGFVYAVKANRYLTHMRKLNDAGEPLQRFLDGARRLKDHLGPVLYQLPPNRKKNLPRLKSFAELLPSELDHVIEFRDRDWLEDDTYELMAKHSLCLCVHDMLPRHPHRLTGPTAYVRFHGPDQKYDGKYRPSRLQGWAEWIDEVVEDHDAFVYFNNDAQGYAVRDAQELRRLMEQQP